MIFFQIFGQTAKIKHHRILISDKKNGDSKTAVVKKSF